jgi:hypothetical protein
MAAEYDAFIKALKARGYVLCRRCVAYMPPDHRVHVDPLVITKQPPSAAIMQRLKESMQSVKTRRRRARIQRRIRRG